MSSGTEATDRKMRDWIELTLDSNRPVWVNLGQASSICWVPEDTFALSLNLASFCRHARAPQRAGLSGAGGYGGNAARTRQPTVIAFVGAKDDVVSVRETPEQILARSKT